MRIKAIVSIGLSDGVVESILELPDNYTESMCDDAVLDWSNDYIATTWERVED
jgi:hypothetical protein